MRVYREFSPGDMPIPRPIWCFDEESLQVGVQLSNTYTDPVAAWSVSLDLTKRQADALNNVLLRCGAAVCRVRGHNYEPVSYPKNTPENPRNHLYFEYEQCTRCWDMQPRKVTSGLAETAGDVK